MSYDRKKAFDENILNIDKEIAEMFRNPAPPSYDPRASLHTNEERLAYYRSHGLTDCYDYPGGDAAFEADVLSGLYHDGCEKGLLREDEYIIKCMYDGRFKFDNKFTGYGIDLRVDVAVYENAKRNGVLIGGFPPPRRDRSVWGV